MRLRSGEIIAATAAILLLVLLFLRWFELRPRVATVGASETGFGALGWLAVLVILLAILGALGLAAATVTRRSPTLPVALQVVTVALGALAVVVIAVRLVAQPGLGVDAPNDEVAVLVPAYLGLAAAILLTYGAWHAMADERTDTPEAREQTERALSVRGAPRPAPPPHAPGRQPPHPGTGSPLADPARPDTPG